MSKGHMEALAALKALRQPIISRPAHKAAQKDLNRQARAAVETVTQATAQTVTRGGRGKKVHASNADRQRAYRRRKKIPTGTGN